MMRFNSKKAAAYSYAKETPWCGLLTLHSLVSCYPHQVENTHYFYNHKGHLAPTSAIYRNSQQATFEACFVDDFDYFFPPGSRLLTSIYPPRTPITYITTHYAKGPEDRLSKM